MPFTLAACNRRTFAKAMLGAGLGLSHAGSGLSHAELFGAGPAKKVDADRWALLSDVHVPADPRTERSGIRPAEHLRRVVEQLLAAESLPSNVLVNGDCTLLMGEPEDYASLVQLLTPVSTAGVPIHLTLGNHDRRDAFRAGVVAIRGGKSEMASHEAAVVETPRADFFLLDSLEETNKLPGRLGAEQLKWLATALDRARDKPAIIAVHHPPQFLPLPEPVGIVDTWPLLEIINPRRRVKAVLFGHVHNWTRTVVGGIHYIGLPPTAYVFARDRPAGWVDARLRDGGMQLELHCLDPKHAEHGERVEFAWRTERA
jgi:3',5'-cyclic-AMP phosphodiesterase